MRTEVFAVSNPRFDEFWEKWNERDTRNNGGRVLFRTNSSVTPSLGNRTVNGLGRCIAEVIHGVTCGVIVPIGR